MSRSASSNGEAGSAITRPQLSAICRADIRQFPGQLPGLIAQFGLEFPVDASAEDSPEDIRPFVASCQKKAEELPLGQHTKLLELLVVEAQDLRHPPVTSNILVTGGRREAAIPPPPAGG